jgi:hypothetical protein
MLYQAASLIPQWSKLADECEWSIGTSLIAANLAKVLYTHTRSDAKFNNATAVLHVVTLSFGAAGQQSCLHGHTQMQIASFERLLSAAKN